MRVRHNMPAMNTYRHMTNIRSHLDKTLERLSSGLRINRAADDAGGLAISEKLRAQVSGLGIAIDNAQDGISLIQTAEGALDRTHAILRRIRDLTILAANGDKPDGDREHYQAEVNQLLTEIDRIAETTEYNTKKLLNGSIGAAATERGDTGTINQDSRLVINGLVRATGEYKLSVYKAAERAQGVIVGGTTTGPAADAAGGFYTFLGAGGSTIAGNYTFKIESEGKIALATVKAKSNAGDSMSEAIKKINDALAEAGIDATASYDANISGTMEAITVQSNRYGSAHEIHIDVSAQPEAAVYTDGNRNAVNGTAFSIYNSDLTDRSGKLLENTQIAGGNLDDMGLTSGIATGTFAVVTRDGTRQTISITSMLATTADATINDLVNRLNAITSLSASYEESSGAISLTDSSSGVDMFKVMNGNNEDFGLADRFGLYSQTYGSNLTGVRIAKTQDYVIKVTDPDNQEAFLRANLGNRSTTFKASSSAYALKSSGIDPDRAGKETANAGGIAGISFSLEEIQLKGVYDNAVHDRFSILAEDGSLTLQVGPNHGWEHRMTVSVNDMSVSGIGLTSELDISTQQAAQDVIDSTILDDAIDRVSRQRGKLGAFQNRLDHTIKNLGVTKENLQSSESRIRDADMAREMMEFTKYQIMMQSATAMLAHANRLPEMVLQLLQVP